MRRRGGIALTALLLAMCLGLAPDAWAGQGEGYFYKQGPKAIPDGHGAAKLRIQSELPNDVDPTIDYVSISLRVSHPRTHDLVAKLKRPNFQYMGSPQSGIPRVITLSNRDTRGKNLGTGKCPASNPQSAPSGFTTLNDLGGPPLPMMPSPSPPLSTGTAPYAGAFAPTEPLSGFNGYHAAPSTDPASPETWTLIVKDVRANNVGELRCAVLYLHRI